MVEVKLKDGTVALVDNEDYKKVKSYSWRVKELHNNKYAKTYLYDNGKQKILFMHRLIMNANIGEEIDHINGNGLDNRKENLRKVSHWQNSMNVKGNKNNKSGYKGVRKTRGKKWRSQIGFCKRTIYLGCFDNKVEAANVYDKKANELFGKYANLNFK